MAVASQGCAKVCQVKVKLVDAHCHLQDERIAHMAAQLIHSATNLGVRYFAVNGTCEEDWGLVKQMSETHSSVIPCFGLHPWFVGKRSSNWLTILKSFFETVPSAAVGEIGLDKGCAQGKAVDFVTQTQVFKQQLELGRQLQKPVSIHCVSAFGDLHEILQEMGIFPAGIILHSYLGSAEMVQSLAKFGAYFSFSGFITSMKLQKARKIVQAVPMDRILLETDAPDALPRLNSASLIWVPGDPSVPPEMQEQSEHLFTLNTVSVKYASPVQEHGREMVDSSFPKKALNHPSNIYNGHQALLMMDPRLALPHWAWSLSKFCQNCRIVGMSFSLLRQFSDFETNLIPASSISRIPPGTYGTTGKDHKGEDKVRI